MSNDNFESSDDGTASGAAYAQLSVPSFTFDDTSDTAVTSTATATDGASGSSFLRLGSFPDLSGTSTYSKAFASSLVLAKLVADTSKNDAVTSAYEIDTDTRTATAAASDTASETATVSGTTETATTVTIDAATGLKTTKVTTTTIDSASTEDHDTIRLANYKGDPAFLVGFMDDTRVRDNADEELCIDGGTPMNTAANRKTETKRLLTKGGFWDHTDGNRITTTSGDKVEVVRGNYKMVILGRQDPSNLDMGRVKIIDVSGGKDAAYTGGLGYGKIQARLVDEHAWATYACENKKNVYKESHGVDVTVFEGSYKESITGKDPKGAGVESTDDDDDPVVVTRTWASEVESYTGSANKPVPHTYTLTNVTYKEDIWAGISHLSFKSAIATISVAMGPYVWEDKVYAASFSMAVSLIYFYGIEYMMDSFDFKAGINIKSYSTTAYVVTDETEVNVMREDMRAARGLISYGIAKLVGKDLNLAYQSTKFITSSVKLVGSVTKGVATLRMIN